MTKNKKNIIIFLCLTIVLFSWLVLNYRLSDSVQDFQLDSESLVTDTILLNLEGDYTSGGFMERGEYIKKQRGSNGTYTSQYGLQFKVFNYLAPKNIEFFKDYARAMRALMAFLFCVTLMFFIYAVKREFSMFVAGFSFVCLMCSTWIIRYAFNLYWVIFVSFIPFALTWFCYKQCKEKNSWALYFFLIGALVFIKSLCGYEYITNVILSPIVPVVYYELLEKSTIAEVVKKVFSVIVSGILGFFLAIAMHVYQGWHYFHSIKMAVSPVFNRAVLQTTGDANSGAIVTFSLIQDLKIYIRYLSVEAMGIVTTFLVSNAFLLLIGLVIIVFGYSFKFNDEVEKRRFRALLASTGFAYLASFSWAFLARGHMRYHIHMTHIIFYLPLYLMLFVLVAFFLQNGCVNGRKK